MKIKTCKKCEREFHPSSNHRECPRCRYQATKTPCVDCGKLGHSQHERCNLCESHNRKHFGRTKHAMGYIYVFRKDHPNATKAGYVFEHKLVMEEHIGRYLLPGENIHHVNGIRDDNRLENLELWVRPQPVGIRARDAVKWAREIIDLYGELET